MEPETTGGGAGEYHMQKFRLHWSETTGHYMQTVCQSEREREGERGREREREGERERA